MPTPLKPEGQRIRRNKTGTEATMPPQVAGKPPALPARPADDPWHPDVVEFWTTLSESPIAQLYTALDWLQLRDTLPLRQMYAKAPSAKLYQIIAKASIGLGLDNADRRRNGWKGGVTPRPPEVKPLPAADKPNKPRRIRDTRSILHAVQGGKR